MKNEVQWEDVMSKAKSKYKWYGVKRTFEEIELQLVERSTGRIVGVVSGARDIGDAYIREWAAVVFPFNQDRVNFGGYISERSARKALIEWWEAKDAADNACAQLSADLQTIDNARDDRCCDGGKSTATLLTSAFEQQPGEFVAVATAQYVHRFFEREDGFQHCSVCGGIEASLPTHCPGRLMTSGERDGVQYDGLNFAGGKWCYNGGEFPVASSTRTAKQQRTEQQPAGFVAGATASMVPR